MKNLMIGIIALTFTACAHPPKTNHNVNQDVALTGTYKANQYSDIYFGGQPPLKELKTLKDQGFSTIISLRKPVEGEYKSTEEAKMAKQAKLTYVNIPYDGKAPLSDKKIAAVTKEVLKHRKKGKTLIHCASGNRAALWAGGHFYKDHGTSKEESLVIAKQLGLTNSTLVENLETYLNQK